MRPSTRFCLWMVAVIVGVLWTAHVFGQESRWHWGDARQAKSVVRIIGVGDGNQQVRGSGVIVQWRGRPVILTAAHVVRGVKSIIVHLHNRRWFVGRVTAIDNTKDLALIDLGDVKDVEAAEIEYRTPPAKGEELTLLGFGSDDRLAYDTGTVRQYVTMGSADARAVDIPCHARPGDSGGPVYNQAGKVVAVVSGANDGPCVIAPICYGWFKDEAKQVAAADKPVLLDFYADWCQPCRDMGSEVATVIQAGYTVRRVNVDREPELAERYQVTGLPCFVVIHGDREIGRQEGALPSGRLLAWIRGVRVTQRAYTGTVPDRVVVDPGHMRPIPMVPVEWPESEQQAQVESTQCGPGGCPIGGGQILGRRPGLGANKEGIEVNGLLPWNRQKTPEPPVIVNVPPPAPSQPVGPDPAVQAQLDAIQAQLNQPPLLPPEPPVEPEPEFNAWFAVIAAALGFGIVFLVHYAREKRS